jgi:hypothetical protein
MDGLLGKIIAHDMLPDSAHSGRCAPEWAEYKLALGLVEKLDPGLVGGPGISPLSELDAAAVALVNAAWLEGTRVGAAFARAEDELDAAFRVCGRCGGYGSDARGADPSASCVGCDGRGYVTRDGQWVRG